MNITSQTPIAHRVILLGASNVTIGLPIVVQNLRDRLQGQLDVYTALGHGRSFGEWSRVLARSLPGILGCEMWEALERAARPTESTLVLVTDVGNDLVYGSPISKIAEWVEICLKRLIQIGPCDIVITSLPMGSLERLSPWRYHLMRTILFPGKGSAWPEMWKRALELNAKLRTISDEFHAHWFDVPGTWYGFDPIHIQRGHRNEAWQQILSGWPGLASTEDQIRPSSAVTQRVNGCRFAERRFLGRLQRATQPTVTFDGMQISLY